MTLKLNLAQRLQTFGLLNAMKQASIADWKIINQAKDTLSLSEDELEFYGITSEGNVVSWKNSGEAAKEKEYDIPQRCYEIIIADLREKDKSGKISSDLAGLAILLLEEE